MSKLEDISKPFREKLIAKNKHNKENEFTSSHPDAISDGDDQGKGENNGNVGSVTDIKVRKISEAKNKFNKNREYNDFNA